MSKAKAVEVPVRFVKVESAVPPGGKQTSSLHLTKGKAYVARANEREGAPAGDDGEEDDGNWQSGHVYTVDEKGGGGGGGAHSSVVHGEITFPDSDPQFRESYVGDMLRQKPHGSGILRWRRGNYVRFDGEFKQGAMKCGILYFGPRGRSRYNGQLQASRAEGLGDLVPDETDDNLLQFYSGDWRNGLKSGLGVAQFRNGDVYEGEWKLNKMSGQGRYRWKDGTLFAGCFREDEMNGPGVCEWSNKRKIHMSFSHQYPSHLRAGVRVICGILLIFTIVYVIPHLFDVGTPSYPPPQGAGGGGGGVSGSEGPFSAASDAGHAPPPGYSDDDSMFVDELVPSATSGLAFKAVIGGSGKAQGKGGDGGSSSSSSATHATPAPAPFSSVTSMIGHSTTYVTPASKLALEFERLFAWPWAWAWPWTVATFYPNAARTSRGAPPPPPPIPPRFGDDFDLDPVSLNLNPCTNPKAARKSGDGDLCGGDGGGKRGAHSPDAPDDLYSSRLFQVSGVSSSAASAAAWRQHGLLPDNTNSGQRYHPSGQASQPRRRKEESRDTAQDDGNGGGAGGGGASTAKPTLWSLLCLYIRMHFKRQVHYLRLGVVILFTLTGDLEDVVCALVWPVFCGFCQLRILSVGVLKMLPDYGVLWCALTIAYAAAAVLCLGAVIALPEFVAEVLRIVCSEDA